MNSPESLLAQAYDGLRKDLQLAEANADQAWLQLLAQSEVSGEPIATHLCATYWLCMAHSLRSKDVIAAAPLAIETARRENDVASEVRLLQALGISYWYLRKMDLALEATRLGIGRCAGQPDCQETLGALHDLEGVIYLNTGKLEESLVCFLCARAVWVEMSNSRKLLGNRLNYACALQHMGDLPGALASSLEARRLLEDIDDQVTRGRLSFNLAIIHKALDDFGSALVEARDAIVHSQATDDLQTLVGAQCILAEVLCDLGDHEGALEYALLSRGNLDDGAPPLLRVNILSSIGELYRRMGMTEEARLCFLTAQSDADCDENPRVLFELRCLQLKLAVDTGQVERAIGEVEELYGQSEELGSVSQQIDLLRVGAEAWEQAGEFAKALNWQRRRMDKFTEHHSTQSDDKLRSLQIKHKLERSLEVQRALEAGQAVLEQHVQRRTEELTEANRKLEREIQERHVAEQEAVKLQASLRQAERLESLGRLAGGVAHDFNNLLTVVMGSARMLSENNHGAPQITAYADEILQSARSGSRLTGRLLAFSKRWDMSISDVPVTDLLSNVLFLTERLIGDSVQLVVELVETEDKVSIDTSQLDSVFMNLALNARDSMPTGGILRVTSELVDEFDLVNPLQREHSGRVLRILVEDQGHGIDEKDLDFIFDPFFTTKSPEKGTGLGLSSSLGIIQHLGGRLTLVRTSPQGTLFEVLLPILESSQDHAISSQHDLIPRRAKEVRADALRGQRILLVEDDVSVRRLLSTQLKFMQLEVFEANDGKHALEMFEAAAPDIILSDVNMPRMSGPELLGELRARGIATPILLASGWPEHHGDQMPPMAGIVAFLQKPFELRTLRTELLKLVEASSAPMDAPQPLPEASPDS